MKLTFAAGAIAILAANAVVPPAEAGPIRRINFTSGVTIYNSFTIRYDDLNSDGLFTLDELLQLDPLITNTGEVYDQLIGVPTVPNISTGASFGWVLRRLTPFSTLGVPTNAFSLTVIEELFSVFLPFGSGQLIATPTQGAFSGFTIDFQDFDGDNLVSPDEIFGFSGISNNSGGFFDTLRQVPVKIGATDGDGVSWSFSHSTLAGGATQPFTSWTYSIRPRGGQIYNTTDPQQGYAPPDPGPDPAEDPPVSEVPLPGGLWLLSGAFGLAGLLRRRAKDT